jgi:pimeloyl-ACP methyl ester carboxylesterase
LITHGWPGSVFEFYKIIAPLTDPETYGGNAADAFHVVCPSMPGYGWSQAPREPGFDVQQVAVWHARLMAELGYGRYLAQGGDWGAIVSAYIGRDDAAHCCGVHVNMVLGFPPENDPDAFEGLTEQDMANFAAMTEFFQKEAGYQQIQGTKPQTLGYALNDSPAGLCAWIVEKFHGWSDCDGNPDNAFSRDELLTNVMIYWLSESITSSMRLYCESMRSGRFTAFEGRCGVPTAAAIFPREIIRPPRKWAERMYDIRQWSEFRAGGHFAALEQPEALVDDVRKFARTLR